MSQTLRKANFAHAIRTDQDRALVFCALTQNRLAIDGQVLSLFEEFNRPRTMPDEASALAAKFGCGAEQIIGVANALHEGGFLTGLDPEQETANVAALLRDGPGRDPGQKLGDLRRLKREGAHEYWSSRATRGLSNLSKPKKRIDVLMFADCDLHREAEFISLEGEQRGLGVSVAATFPDDSRLAAERPHDIILIGALRARGHIAAKAKGSAAVLPYLDEVRALLKSLRQFSDKPILIDNLPEPTVQPFGIGERGIDGHLNRFRQANLALAEVVEEFEDVHVVDVAACLSRAGSERWVDDNLLSFTHLGSPGWMLLRPESEKQAVHNQFPDVEPLVELCNGDAYGRERIISKAHIDAMVSVLAIDQKKCVIVDLDGVLWPGVIAETGAPFSWDPAISGLSSFIGLYVGIHEALKMLKRRGILLAAASKNDESVLRKLWTYPENYPRDRLLVPDDFVAWRVNWNDKPANIAELVSDLGFSPSSFLFIDDHPHERARVQSKFPEIEVWGENLFTLRRNLLDDPRLQRPRLTREAEARDSLTRAKLEREKLRSESSEEAEFIRSLQLNCKVERATTKEEFTRVSELFLRTTQFNTTSRKFSLAELSDPQATWRVYILRVADRFIDHGLVAAAIVKPGEIVAFAMSCRVIGLKVEQELLSAVIKSMDEKVIVAHIEETPRNLPVRNLYKDAGFAKAQHGAWVLQR